MSDKHAALKHIANTSAFVSISFFATFISASLQFIIMAGICFCLIQIATEIPHEECSTMVFVFVSLNAFKTLTFA